MWKRGRAVKRSLRVYCVDPYASSSTSETLTGYQMTPSVKSTSTLPEVMGQEGSGVGRYDWSIDFKFTRVRVKPCSLLF